MADIIIIQQGRRFEKTVEKGTSVYAAVNLTDGAVIHAPCGGKHTCGKCRVRAEGALSAVSAEEARFLSGEEITRGIRLACFALIEGGCVIETDCNGSADILKAGDTRGLDRDGYGAAVDIGTTTVTLQIFDLRTGRSLCTAAELNGQAGFGADVISRIQYQMDNTIEPLHSAITGQLGRMLRGALEQTGIKAADISAAVVTGNTTMLHFLCGLDASGIAAAPFVPQSLFGTSVPASSVFATVSADFSVYLPPCVGAYVGADITCGMLAAGSGTNAENTILCDIGTNGEMALMGADGKLLCCSTAAGPAFEGASIYQGMMSVNGAINSVKVSGGKIAYTTIGGEPARGMCGSGLLDATAAFLKLGCIDDSGAVDEDRALELALFDEVNGQPALKLGDSGVLLTAGDIRKVQLAKSAIRAGLETLMSTAGLAPRDIGRLIIAGGFGYHLNKQSAADIGMIPAALLDVSAAGGNTAAMGAALLFDEGLRSGIEELADKMEELPLSGSAEFMDYYIEHMMFADNIC